MQKVFCGKITVIILPAKFSNEQGKKNVFKVYKFQVYNCGLECNLELLFMF